MVWCHVCWFVSTSAQHLSEGFLPFKDFQDILLRLRIARRGRIQRSLARLLYLTLAFVVTSIGVAQTRHRLRWLWWGGSTVGGRSSSHDVEVWGSRSALQTDATVSRDVQQKAALQS